MSTSQGRGPESHGLDSSWNYSNASWVCAELTDRHVTGSLRRHSSCTQRWSRQVPQHGQEQTRPQQLWAPSVRRSRSRGARSTCSRRLRAQTRTPRWRNSRCICLRMKPLGEVSICAVSRLVLRLPSRKYVLIKMLGPLPDQHTADSHARHIPCALTTILLRDQQKRLTIVPLDESR